jgi:hypothetical protein
MFFAEISGAVGSNLDADHAQLLDGESGLRGYPLRFQFGSSRALLTLEERVYTHWSILHLAQVGAAVFADVGRTWGPVPFGAALAWSGTPADTNNLGTLSDIGFGLRLGNMRSALANVLHLDVAVPLQGSYSIRDVQFLVQTKHSF